MTLGRSQNRASSLLVGEDDDQEGRREKEKVIVVSPPALLIFFVTGHFVLEGGFQRLEKFQSLAMLY